MARRPSQRIGAFKEAVEYFRSRIPRTGYQLDSLEDVEREQAFSVAGVAKLDIVTQVWEALDRAIASGTSFDTFKKSVGKELTKAWGEERPYRVETIFRTNVQTAYNAGRWEQMTDPEVRELRPFFRYLAILDTRTTVLICRPIANTVLPQSHSFWRSHWPPLHFSCRSTILAITDEQADETGRTPRAPHVLAQEGFGKTPDQRGYVPDTSQAPPELVRVMKQR